MGITRWFRTWGTLLVAVIALTVSCIAIYLNNVHYQETTKTHTQHEEIYDRLARLDDKIGRTEQSIINMQALGQDISEPSKSLMKAKELRNQAELAWDTGQYPDADKSIREAYDVLQEIPPPPANWWLIGGVIAAFIIIGIIIGVVVWRLVIRRRVQYGT